MQFLHPWFLLGLAGVSVPIFIHLVKMKARIVLFPSLRFLQQVDRQVARQKKLQDLLILALRCLTILLLSLALAAPVIGRGSGSGGTAIVIVLDDSASMGLLDAEGPVFARAKGMARSILKSLQPGDSACVLTSARDPVMSRDGGALASELDRVEPSQGAGALGPLVKSGLKLLRECAASQRELYVISDFQKRAVDWDRMDWTLREGNVILMPITSARQDNLSVTSLEPISPFATEAAPFRVRATVANRGPESASKNLSIRVDDRVVAEQLVFVAGRNSVTLAADIAFDKAGWKVITAQLDDDALRADNRRILCVDVRSQLSVLICRPRVEGTLSRSFYIAKALNPGGAANTGVRIVECDPEELAGHDPNDFAVVFLVESVPVDEETLSVLRNFVAGGGSLAIVAGPTLDPDAFNGALAANGSDLGPLSPARYTGAAGDERNPQSYRAIREIDLHHPIFARLRRGENPIDLGSAAFYRIALTEPFEKEGARVLARFASGEPAVVERAYGLGRVLLLATALHTDATNLPVKVGFLPLMHSLVSYLTAPENAEGRLVGDRLRLQFPKDRAPASAKLYRTPTDPVETKAEIQGGLANFDFGTASAPGSVIFEWLTSEKIESRAMAINVDAEEGSLETADLTKAFPAEAHRVKNSDELTALLASIRYGQSLAIFFLIAALALGVIESVLANRFAFGRTERA